MSKNKLMQSVALTLFGFALSSCGGGGGGGGTTPAPVTPPTGGGGGTGGGTGGSVTISGAVTFDLVPSNTSTSGLNYNATTQEPARGVVVEVLDSGGTILFSDVTDDAGNYSFTVDSGTNVRIRAKAQMLQTSGAQWDVRVIDNTSSDSLYAIQGALSSSGTADSTRNLHAASGWGGSSYTSQRAAAPFAILNPIYDTVQKFAAVDPDIVFPLARFGWSINNRAAAGNPALGEISTSSYVGNGQIFILGDDNSDTDEYDDHVVIHEWGHYYEDQISRADSIGGPHGSADRLDMRVAMGEGWGNALSAIITDDPFYRDSFGNQQSQGFSINVENNSYVNEGWFNEGSVQSIIYDIYDGDDDGADALSLGLGPIHAALNNPDYINNTFFTSIFLFLDQVKSDEPASVSAIDALSAAQDINGTGPTGVGETNNGGIAASLPVYKTVTVNGPAVEVCSLNDAGTFNKLVNRDFLQFTTASSGALTIVMTRTSGSTVSDPDLFIFRNGTPVASGTSAAQGTETVTATLAAGDYVIDAYDFNNTGQSAQPTSDTCFDFSITQ